jgi:hypothetical protein
MDPVTDILNVAEENYLSAKGKSLGAKAQMLSDLGYLNTEFLSGIFMENKIAEAYQAFYTDLQQSGLKSTREINEFTNIYQDQAGLKLLESVTDIDEGILFTKLPELGEPGLMTRIIHYRLSLLGLYTGPIQLNYNAFSYAGLEKAATYVNKSKLSTLNLLANLQSYTEAFLIENGFLHSVVAFKSGISGKQKDVPEYSGKFKRQIRQDLKDHETQFEILEEKLFRRNDDNVDLALLQSMAGEEINRFILRLIQLHQWMAGYYNGALDADFGELTLESLIEIIENYNEGSDDKVRAADVLARVRDDYFIFNCLYFLKQYKEENRQADQTMNTLAMLSDSYSKAEPDEQLAFETNFQAEIEVVRSGQDAIPETKNGVLRRVFFGIRTFFKKAFRFARKLFRWIVSGLKQAVTFVNNAIRMIYTFLKDAIRHFIEGVKFLLGKLPVTTQSSDGRFMYSNFDLDKDGLNIFETANASDVKIHMDMVRQKVHSMSFSLALIGFLYDALKAALSAAAVIAWPLFILKLVIAFKKVIDTYKTVLTT